MLQRTWTEEKTKDGSATKINKLFYIWTKCFTVNRKGRKKASFYYFTLVSVHPQYAHIRSVLVPGYFGVVLRVDVPAQVDGQDHPEQLSNT